MNMREEEPIVVKFEEVEDDKTNLKQHEKTSSELENLEKNQQEENAAFKNKEERINHTKEKLQELLKKLQEKSPKETIAKKLLRIKINRLRNRLNRSMVKFDIEYQANLEDAATYEPIKEECISILDRIERLEDERDELEVKLATYIKTENYRSKRRVIEESELQKIGPKCHKKPNVKNEPKKSRSQEVENQLKKVELEILELQDELEGKKAYYREYKVNLKDKVKDDIDTRMKELKQEEAKRKKQQKEELAISNPTIWTKIIGKIKTTIAKVAAWNKKRKNAKVERNKKRDANISREAEAILSKKTAREQFEERNKMNPILKEFVEASKQDDFDMRAFKEEIEKRGYNLDELIIGFEAIDTYSKEHKEREEISKNETKTNNRQLDFVQEQEHESEQKSSQQTEPKRTTHTQFAETMQINPIFKAYQEASKSTDFSIVNNKKAFIEEMKKRGYSLDELINGMNAIYSYMEEHKEREEISKNETKTNNRQVDFVQEQEHESEQKSSQQTEPKRTTHTQFAETMQINPIFKAYQEASKSTDFSIVNNKKAFIEEMKKRGYSLDELRNGMNAIDTYREEQKERKETNKNATKTNDGQTYQMP